MVGKGGYILATEGGRMLTVVDPEKKQYVEMNVETLLNSMTSVMNAVGGMMKMETSNVSVNVEKLGAGEKMQGYNTVKYRLTQDYTMKVSVLGMNSTNTTHSVGEYWYAPELTSIVNPFMQFGERVGQSALFRNSDFLSKVQAARQQMGQGVPLKSVVTTQSSDDKGRKTSSVATTEMLNIKQADVPASAFAVPAGYAKQVMPTLDSLKGLQASANGDVSGKVGAAGKSGNAATDVAGAAKEGATEGVKEAAKEGAKEKAGKALRGLFGRKP
jgi:hypothetical protein